MNRDLEKLFDQAADLTGPDRQKFLAENCSDPALRRELDLLLAHDDGAETFLQRAISEEASSALQSLVFAPGQRIGHYRVLSIIGRGGMGLVYLAERADGKFEQRVAIKVLQSALDLELLGERIQQECRILASLEHPPGFIPRGTKTTGAGAGAAPAGTRCRRSGNAEKYGATWMGCPLASQVHRVRDTRKPSFGGSAPCLGARASRHTRIHERSGDHLLL